MKLLFSFLLLVIAASHAGRVQAIAPPHPASTARAQCFTVSNMMARPQDMERQMINLEEDGAVSTTEAAPPAEEGLENTCTSSQLSSLPK